MAVMRAVGYRPLPPHARVRAADDHYVIELDVADFTIAELSVEAVGPVVTVRGQQVETEADQGLPFRIKERLEETFRLPDDADAETLSARHKHGVLELRVGRILLQPRHVQITRRRPDVFNPDAEAV